MRRIKTLVTVWRSGSGDSLYGHDVPSDDELRAAVPPEIDLSFLKPEQRLSDHIADVEVLYGPLLESDFPRAKKLRWVQLNSTGADVMMYDAFVQSGIELTSLGAAITTTVAEHALSLLLALVRNLHVQRDHQREKRWEAAWGNELGKLRLGLLGYGRIGRAVAERAQGFGMDIVAIDAAPSPNPNSAVQVWGPERLPEFLSRTNALICTAPKTPQTYHIISTREIELMPPPSYIVNVGRGGVVDEAALAAALRRRRLVGAALDVTEVEPLPPDSPLWTEPHLLLTPHSAGFSADLREKKINWFVNNLTRYIRGEALQGKIDPSRGF